MFTATDRCDRCGAQAYNRYKNDSLELLFCAHHNNIVADAITRAGFYLVDTQAVPV